MVVAQNKRRNNLGIVYFLSTNLSIEVNGLCVWFVKHSELPFSMKSVKLSMI